MRQEKETKEEENWEFGLKCHKKEATMSYRKSCEVWRINHEWLILLPQLALMKMIIILGNMK